MAVDTTTQTDPVDKFNALTGVPAPLNTAQISKQAMSQATTQTKQQVDPLQGQIGTLNTEQKQAAGDITGMFNKLQPVVQQGATNVQRSYDAAQVSEQAIFTQAMANLNGMAQGQAQQAQMLAQQIGAPVAVENFTSPAMAGIGELAALGAGQQLHTLAYAQAGEQEAQAFASQVFPLVRTEQQAQNRTFYQNQVKELRNQITKIRAQKGSLFTQRFNELQAQEKTYALDRAKVALDAHTALLDYRTHIADRKEQAREADQSYKAQVASNALEQKKLDHTITEDQLADQRADKAQTLEGRRVTAEEKQAAASTREANARIANMSAEHKLEARRVGISERELDYRIQQSKITSKAALGKFNADRYIMWDQLMEGAINPKPSTYTHTDYVQAAPTDPEAFQKEGADGKMHWVKITSRTDVVPANNIHDPNKVVDFLVAHGEPKKRATDAVRARMGLPDSWKYGEKYPPAKAKPSPSNFAKRSHAIVGAQDPNNLFTPHLGNS